MSPKKEKKKKIVEPTNEDNNDIKTPEMLESLKIEQVKKKRDVKKWKLKLQQKLFKIVQ